MAHGENCLCDMCVTHRFERSESGRSRRDGQDRDQRGRRSGPLIAKNPANQAYLNKIWEEEQTKRKMEAAQRRARAARQAQPYTEEGGGNDCEDCGGSKKCRQCEDGQYKLRDGSYRPCRACRWNPGWCYACRGTGKERQTRHRRD